jgi:hypothetical protein
MHAAVSGSWSTDVVRLLDVGILFSSVRMWMDAVFIMADIVPLRVSVLCELILAVSGISHMTVHGGAAGND